VPVRVAVMCPWYAPERGGKLVFLSFLFFSPIVNRTAPLGRRRRNRKLADKGGYRLPRIPSTLNIPIAITSRYSPRIITADKGKKRNRPRQWECNFRFPLTKIPRRVTTSRVVCIPSHPSGCLPEFFAFDYIAFLQITLNFDRS